jgi:uncharacterized membrane protein
MSEPQSHPSAELTPDEVHAQYHIQTLSTASPFRWLRLGWHDMLAHPGIALFYGVSFCVMAWVLKTVFHNSPEYTLSAISGCLLVGPFLAMGLYDVSMRRAQGETPSLSASLVCWKSHTRTMGMLVMVMIVLELLWGRASLVVFAVFFNTGLPNTASVLEAVFNPQNWEFVIAYFFVGGFFAGLVFASMMVAIPMILHHDTDAITACVTSLRVFVTQNRALLGVGADHFCDGDVGHDALGAGLGGGGPLVGLCHLVCLSRRCVASRSARAKSLSEVAQ